MIQNLMTYGALSTKTRALYGKRLRLADYEHMAALKTEAEILDYLRQQPGWAVAVAELGSGYAGPYVGRMELESVLWDQINTEYQRLDHYVPRQDKLIMQFPVLQAEQRAILSALRRLKAGHVRPMNLSAAKLLAHGKVDTKALEACTDYESLLAACRESLYFRPLLKLRNQDTGAPPDYTATETLLRSTYFSHMYKIIHHSYAGETQKVLLRAYGEQIDLLNIIHILRLKTYFPGTDSFYSVLFPFNYRLRPDFIHALCSAPDAGAVFDLLRESPYAQSFEDIRVTEVEDYYRQAFYLFNKRQLITGKPSIYTAMAYLNLKESELRVLVNIIESVKYGVAFDTAFAKLIGD